MSTKNSPQVVTTPGAAQERRAEKMKEKRDISEIKNDILVAMRNRVIAEESLHFLMVELLDAIVSFN